MPDTKELIEYGGLLLVFLVVYSQTGFFFCFFMPSGAFMFATGAMVASGSLDYNLTTVCILLIMAAITGNITGYFFGKKAGLLLYQRPDSRFFKQKHLAAAAQFYDKHGGRALAIGLFLPIVRTFAPLVAGMIRMKLKRFILYIAIGSICWVSSFLLTGFLVGSRPFFRPYLKYMVTGIVVLVSIPVIVKILREWKMGEKKLEEGS